MVDIAITGYTPSAMVNRTARGMTIGKFDLRYSGLTVRNCRHRVDDQGVATVEGPSMPLSVRPGKSGSQAWFNPVSFDALARQAVLVALVEYLEANPVPYKVPGDSTTFQDDGTVENCGECYREFAAKPSPKVIPTGKERCPHVRVKAHV